MTFRLGSALVTIASLIGCSDARHIAIPAATNPTGQGVPALKAANIVRSSGGMGMANIRDGATDYAPVKIAEVYGGGTPNDAQRDRVPILDPTAGEQSQAIARKILYSADLSIVVEDFPKTTDALTALVKKVGGYVADNDVTGSPGNHRVATWKVRVPVAKFDAFLDLVSKLGELERKQLHSQDVTEEFFDLETRIKTKKVEEDRLVKHLTDSTGKLDDILAVEREISRVRGEVERMEGRIRLLANLAELTTVNITAHERTGFVPETAPTFAIRATRTFTGSAENLLSTVQYLTLQAISIVPWLPLWILLFALIGLFFRRRRIAARSSLARSVAP